MKERELKFRIWVNIDKAFIYFDIYDYPIGIAFGVSAPMQFTGLKDHKDKECYEGDIVRYFNLPPFEISTGLLGEVRFINGRFCIKCRDRSKGGNVTWITEFDDVDYFEVIGDICETPELLK